MDSIYIQAERLAKELRDGLQFLLAIGFTQEKIEEILVGLSEDVSDRLVFQVSQQLTPEDETNLTKAFMTGLNDSQKNALIAELYKQKTGESLEDLQQKLVNEAIETTIKELVIATLAQEKYLDMIPEPECEQITSLVEQQQWLEAFGVMKKYVTIAVE